MQSITNENNLLKVYIGTLEKQNEARNIERDTLYSEIEKMNKQITRLESLLSKSSPPTPAISKQIAQLKQNNIELNNQLAAFKKESTRIVSELQVKQSQIVRIEKDRQKLSLSVDEQTELRQLANRKVSSLENQIANLKAKITQFQKNRQQSFNKISDLQAQNKTLQSKCSQLLAELQKEKDLIIELQHQNQQLRATEKSSAQFQSLQGIKLGLEATIKRLNTKVEWHEINSKAFEQERLHREAKIKQMEAQLNKANSSLAEYHSREEANAITAASRKEKEVQALEQMIGSLKDNKKYLEKSLKEKSQIITALESQVYQLRSSQAIQQNLENEINTLVESKAEADKQVAIAIKSNQDLSYEIEMLKQKQEGYLTELSSFRRERETLLREIDQYRTSLEEARGQLKTFRSKSGDYTFNMKEVSPRYRAEKDVRGQRNEDLRLMVLGLQQQVNTLKASQVSRPPSMLQNSQVESYLSINSKASKAELIMQSRSPPSRITHNQQQKMSFNKNKWESLQWKINLLRNQNETLKKTLFD